jgi:hypothetical protein
MWSTSASSRRLTHHFVGTFFGSGLESVEGADGVRRVILGVLSALFTIGLFLPRMMAVKYHAARTPELYAVALAGDTLMTLAFAMLAAALAAALAGESLFPNETDFRVLTPLPISRAFVFGAKLRAVALYLGIVVIVVSVGLQLPFTVVSGGRYAEHPWLWRAAVHTSVSVAASLVAALVAMAVQGVVIVGAPARYLRVASVAARTAIICGVVLLVPFAGRLPRLGRPFVDHSPVLYLVPPAWFAGGESVLLGAAGGYGWTLAVLALGASAAAFAAVSVCYLTLYRHFDLVILRAIPAVRQVSDIGQTGVRHAFDMGPTGVRHESDMGPTASRHRSDMGPTPVRRQSDARTTAVGRFARTVLRRSPLHQVVFLGVTAGGAGLVLNSLLGAGVVEWLRTGGPPPPALTGAVTTMPYILMLATTVGLRAALLLPHEPRANWVFRLTDRDDYRPAQLDAVDRLFLRLAVVPAIAATMPVAAVVIGPLHALAMAALAVCCGLILVEILIHGWRRLPFTCGYIPGKRHIVETLLIALVTYIAFTGLGRVLTTFSRPHPSRFLIALGILLMLLAAVRRSRLASWGNAPLVFDDDPPDTTPPLQLS